jgi:hypothetical protein
MIEKFIIRFVLVLATAAILAVVYVLYLNYPKSYPIHNEYGTDF